MTNREHYTPGPPAERRYERTETSGRLSLSENCIIRRRKSGRRLLIQRICASGLPLRQMRAWAQLEPR